MNYLEDLFADPSFMGALLGALITGFIAIGLFIGENRKRKRETKMRNEKYKAYVLNFFLLIRNQINHIESLTKEVIRTFKDNDTEFEREYIKLIISDISKSSNYMQKILVIDPEYKSKETIDLSSEISIILENINEILRASTYSRRRTETGHYIDSMTSLAKEAKIAVKTIDNFMK